MLRSIFAGMLALCRIPADGPAENRALSLKLVHPGVTTAPRTSRNLLYIIQTTACLVRADGEDCLFHQRPEVSRLRSGRILPHMYKSIF